MIQVPCDKIQHHLDAVLLEQRSLVVGILEAELPYREQAPPVQVGQSSQLAHCLDDEVEAASLCKRLLAFQAACRYSFDPLVRGMWSLKGKTSLTCSNEADSVARPLLYADVDTMLSQGGGN